MLIIDLYIFRMLHSQKGFKVLLRLHAYITTENATISRVEWGC